MYDRILLPTDGSPGVETAVEEALDLATLSGGTVHALYVVDTRDYSTLPEGKWLTLASEFERRGEAAVGDVADAAARRDVPAETAIEQGLPHETILEYADDTDVDVVVMGTHARSGLDRFLLGSVTEKVVRGAHVPVLVVRIAD